MNDDDLIPKQFQDPYDRLEELEALTTSQCIAMEQMAEQIKEHSENFVKISEAMLQIANVIQFLKMQNASLQQQAQNLHHRIRVLENKETDHE